MARFAVVLDACVLYPAPLRDLLLQLAVKGLFRAKWTDAIHEEWIGSLLRRRDDLSRDALERTRRLMDEAVPDYGMAADVYAVGRGWEVGPIRC